MKMMYFPSFVSGSVFTARLFPLAGFFCPEYEPFNDGPPPPRDRRIYTGYMVLVNDRYLFAYKATALPLELNQHIWRDSVDS